MLKANGVVLVDSTKELYGNAYMVQIQGSNGASALIKDTWSLKEVRSIAPPKRAAQHCAVLKPLSATDVGAQNVAHFPLYGAI